MAESGNELSRRILTRLVSCPPAAVVLEGPRWTGKWKAATETAEGLSSPEDLLNVDGSIGGAREARSFVQLRPMSGDLRVVLVDARSGMSEPAQDAYLKMCEDTPDFASVVIVLEEAESLRPALVSRLDIVKWHPASVEDIEKAGNLDSFCMSVIRGRIELRGAVSERAGELQSLHSAVQALANGSPSIADSPKILGEWQKLNDDEKGAVIFVCENALSRAESGRGVLAVMGFVDSLRACPTISAEIHWWRACMAM